MADYSPQGFPPDTAPSGPRAADESLEQIVEHMVVPGTQRAVMGIYRSTGEDAIGKQERLRQFTGEVLIVRGENDAYMSRDRLSGSAHISPRKGGAYRASRSPALARTTRTGRRPRHGVPPHGDGNTDRRPPSALVPVASRGAHVLGPVRTLRRASRRRALRSQRGAMAGTARPAVIPDRHACLHSCTALLHFESGSCKHPSRQYRPLRSPGPAELERTSPGSADAS